METDLGGIGASPGIGRGRAHWIRSAQDVETFCVGEVLLAAMTSPDWGEVFQKAAGVVTEQGGMLCHAAIVAREEGIPAVVGVGEELQNIAEGSFVIVNGDDGVVSTSNQPKESRNGKKE
jgi:phosphoenolpyruvate synthase/pyruvate phosphate dikinase